MLWRTERHILDEQPTALDFARPATTPWINAFQLKGMQRSSKIDVSELINILKLELFSPPTKAKESNAQRARRANLLVNKRGRPKSDKSDDNRDYRRDKLKRFITLQL